MIRTKANGTGDVVQAVRHIRKINAQIRQLQGIRPDEVFEVANLQVPYALAEYVHKWRDFLS